MNKINIAIDVFSYTKNIWSVSDYSGEQIYSKLALPLFRHRKEALELFSVKSFEQHDDQIILNLRDDLYWSNGDRVTAHDYARAINYILRTENNRYQKLLLSVFRHPVGVEVIENNVLLINTSWYDPFIVHYLSLINFSPMHISDLNLYAGPYKIKKMSEEICELEPNSFFCGDKNEGWVEYINYILLPSDPEACAFHRGDVHVSCDTSLDLHRYRQSLQKADFHQGSETLVMLLSPGNKFNELPFDILQLTSCAVDRLKISALYDSMLEPVESWLSFYKQSFYECDFPPAFRRSSSVEVDVAFEDFYPNKEILQHLAAQLSCYNVLLNLHDDKYGCWVNDCHFRFEIRKIPKNSPIQLIRSDVSRLSKSAVCYNEMKKEYSKLYLLENKHRLLDIFKTVDLCLRQQVLYIPLFIFPTGYFCHPKINASSIMLPGSRIIIRE